ncbi:glucose dehydrogenase [FAD, quinone] isoform X1 [Acyrthosiphon pisum]|uniref:Glucose-methanol-choline oxidoreductase N-terminal domain-containing protein n=1 Tax=Acyrthosiphon pisum TaxID=7029 RepID=A0A8R2A4Q8_ACYPI|nr:glucose dehydrogenase [FAD, quinone] isoform X1 [Acyrthosiphon pisum]|eukprot:XP_001946057.1 PREDICTED: glucose dehydrogenase [FAD, quinone] isoform X1 [Acyrthosiphon pisum]
MVSASLHFQARTVVVLLLLQCSFVVIVQSVSSPARSYPPLFQSALKFLGETLVWESNETVDRAKVLPEYDFIVVGAGSAGSVVASRLSEVKKWQVLLIEAGQQASHIMDVPLAAPFLQFSSINWKYRTVPMNNSCLGMEGNRCKFPRGKVMGGSSVLNYMIYTRGNRKDYDNWADMGNTGWDYNSVLKYFIKSENANLSHSEPGYHGKNGLLSVSDVPYRTPIAKAFVEAGSQIGLPVVDVNGEKQVGINYLQATMKNGLRHSTNAAFLFPAKRRSNLHVKKFSTVTKILIHKSTKKAIGVEFVRSGKKTRVFARKEVIVSGGAINTPQLLMLSGIGPKQHLADLRIPLVADLPVGENLMDHVSLGGLVATVNDTVSIRLHRVFSDPYILNELLQNHNGLYTVPGGPEALSFVDVNSPDLADGHPNLELLLVTGLYSTHEMMPKLCGMRPDLYDAVYRATEGMDGFTVFPMVMRPKSRGRVWLRDANPFHHPLIDPNYFADEADLDVIVAGVRLVQQMLRTGPMRSLNATVLETPLPGCVQHVFDTDAYWKCAARQISFTIYHLSGTCKMGPATDPTSVVDPRLRVHGISSLRVVDASIIPEVPAAHTNAPTIMIAEKASDMIKEDWDVRT